jgi:hypothetical protein
VSACEPARRRKRPARAAALLAACLLAPACAGARHRALHADAPAPWSSAPEVATEPPAAPGAKPLDGFRLAGAERAASTSLRFDVDALPVAEWDEPRRGAGFVLHKTKDGWNLWVSTTLFAEVIVATGATHLEGAARVSFTAFTGGRNFGVGVPPVCGTDTLGSRLAFWSGFAPAKWTDAGVDVEMEDGDFDLATCTATPKRSLFGRAGAIVPGYLYALRVRDEDTAGRSSESLVVYMPRGALVSTTVDPTTPLNASNTGPFTRLTLPLERGTAGAASVRVSPASLSLWSRLRRAGGFVPSFDDPTPPHDDLLLGVDVAWQGDARVGTVTFAPPPGRDARPYSKLLAAAKL